MDVELLSKCISLTAGDIRGVVQVLFHRSAKDEIRDGEVLSVLLYDLMKAQGYEAAQLTPMLAFFNKELVEVSKSLMRDHLKHIPMVSLQTFDNRFTGLAGYGGMHPKKFFDMTESKAIETLPRPLVSGLIVIPELISRARKSVEALARLHSAGGASPKS